MFHSYHEIICNHDDCSRKDTIQSINISEKYVRETFEDQGWVFSRVGNSTYCPDHQDWA